MAKRKSAFEKVSKEGHPFNESVGKAMMGDPSGVHEMLFIFSRICSDITVLGVPIGRKPLPPLMLARLNSIGKECKALSEFADGYVRGHRDAKAEK